MAHACDRRRTCEYGWDSGSRRRSSLQCATTMAARLPWSLGQNLRRRALGFNQTLLCPLRVCAGASLQCCAFLMCQLDITVGFAWLVLERVEPGLAVACISAVNTYFT